MNSAEKTKICLPPRRLWRLLLRLAAITQGACAQGASDLPPDIQTDSQAIIHGTHSTSAQSSVVMLRIADEALCTGTLVAPNLVLTARHCVSETDESVQCSPRGRALEGGRIHGNRDPEDIVVYTGLRESTLRARARGASIVHDSAHNLCNHDLAFVVLDRPVTREPIAALRLEDTTRPGERITSVGWGLTEAGSLPSARMQRTEVQILDVGPSRQASSAEIVVGEAICSGDSGGPAFSSHGAIIGVVSYGGGGSDGGPDDQAAGCIGANARNVYTKLAAFPALVREAFSEANATPRLESR